MVQLLAETQGLAATPSLRRSARAKTRRAQRGGPLMLLALVAILTGRLVTPALAAPEAAKV